MKAGTPVQDALQFAEILVFTDFVEVFPAILKSWHVFCMYSRRIDSQLGGSFDERKT